MRDCCACRARLSLSRTIIPTRSRDTRRPRGNGAVAAAGLCKTRLTPSEREHTEGIAAAAATRRTLGVHSPEKGLPQSRRRRTIWRGRERERERERERSLPRSGIDLHPLAHLPGPSPQGRSLTSFFRSSSLERGARGREGERKRKRALALDVFHALRALFSLALSAEVASAALRTPLLLLLYWIAALPCCLKNLIIGRADFYLRERERERERGGERLVCIAVVALSRKKKRSRAEFVKQVRKLNE